MYEIWLAINILWEIALSVWPALLVAAVLWLALMFVALKRPAPSWRAARSAAIVAALLGFALAIPALPALTRSSLSAMGYWVDWLNLVAISAAAAAVVAAFVWPIGTLLQRPPNG